jgi:uncharacterized protein
MAYQNLSEKESSALDELIHTIDKEYPDAKYRLFGSKTTGFADDESDIDLLIMLENAPTDEIRKQIVYMVFDVNLEFGSNISALIVSRQEWDSPLSSLLPLHFFVEKEGIPL